MRHCGRCADGAAHRRCCIAARFFGGVALAAVAGERGMSPGAHGGDVQRVARDFGVQPEDLLDFSANVNPRGLPPRAAERLAREARDPRLVARYPDPEAWELRDLLSGRLGVRAESVVIGAGAACLIHAAVRALAPERCVIPIPAFSEYARAARAYGCEVQTIPLAARPAHRSGDLIVINNPHNPTGACASRAEMLERIATARASGATVLADEAFVDYAPEAAITREAAAQDGVIAIRSLTKFLGCPGLRVGYGVAAPETARRLAAQLPAWPVTTLALNAVTEALRDDDYARQTLQENQRARDGFAEALGRLGCQVLPSAANFLLLRLPEYLPAAQVRERLIGEHAILVRDCDSFEGLERGRYLRVAVRFENEN